MNGYSYRGTRGSALITAMVAVFAISAVIVGLFRLVLGASNESIAQLERARTRVAADVGLERAAAHYFKARLTDPVNNHTIVGAATGAYRFGYAAARTADVPPPYAVWLRDVSDRVPHDKYVHSIVEATSLSRGERDGSYAGSQMVLKVNYNRQFREVFDQRDPTSMFPAAAQAGSFTGANSPRWKVDGSDRVRSRLDIQGIELLTDVNVKMDSGEITSSAGWRSDFYVQAGNDPPVRILSGVNWNNHPVSTSTAVFHKGQTLNFFIDAIDAPAEWGGPIKHYAFPRPDYVDPVTGDDPAHAYTGSSTPYQPWFGVRPTVYYEHRPYCRIEQIDDVTYMLFFEDMPGDKADWDNGTPGDLTWHADQVVKVSLLPNDGVPPGQQQEPWVLTPGVPAIGYTGEYDDLGVPDDTDQIVYKYDDGTMQAGADAHTTVTVPMGVYDDVFVDFMTPDDTFAGTEFDHKNHGTAADMQFNHVTGDVRLTGNFSGAGILYIDGNLEINGVYSYDGIIICTGDVTIGGGNAGDSRIMGTIVAGGRLTLNANGRIFYNSDLVQQALASSGDPVATMAAFRAAFAALRTQTLMAFPGPISSTDVLSWREFDDASVASYITNVIGETVNR